MEQEIGHSVARTNPHACRWVIGTLMVCEEADGSESVPADAIAEWQDGDTTLYLRKRSANELLEGNFAADRVHIGGTSAAVWCLGENTFCKAHAWIEGLELEANNLRFVAEKMPDVTIPEVIYTWIDRKINRTFLLTKRVEGQILNDVWPRLSSLQRTEIANYIARVCVTLAANTSSRLETITGCGIYEPYLLENAPKSHPTWKPRLLGPFQSPEALHACMAEASSQPPPAIDPTFHFYHADLGPTNTMASEDGRVTGIIDWESAAFYPRFFLATKPSISGGFNLGRRGDKNRGLWADLLTKAIEAHGGYEPMLEKFRCWSDGKLE